MQSTDSKWLEWRSQGVGASDMPTICRQNKWQSREALWNIKKGIDVVEENDSMWFGKVLEPIIIDRLWNQKDKPKAMHNQVSFVHKDFPNLFCTPDALLDDYELLQIKTSRSFTAFKNNECPEYFKIQVQFELEVMNYNKGYLLVVVSGDWDNPKIFEIRRDEELGKALVKWGRWFCQSLECQKNPFFNNEYVGENYGVSE